MNPRKFTEKTLALSDTPEKAATNLLDAIRIASPGKTVLLCEGRYPLKERAVVADGVKVVGRGIGKTFVVHEEPSNYGFFTLAHKDSLISSMTLLPNVSSGYSNGAGIAARITAGTLHSCKVAGISAPNVNTDGYAIYADGKDSRITRTLVAGCKGGRWGTVLMMNGAVIDNSAIYDCIAAGQYGALLYIDRTGGPCFATNVTFSSTEQRAVFAYHDDSKFVNCIFDCIATAQGGGDYGNDRTGMFLNCASTAPRLPELDPDAQNIMISDACFRDKANGDFNLLRTSPAIGKGRYHPWMRTGRDFNGKIMSKTGVVDIGAFQYRTGPLQIIFR